MRILITGGFGFIGGRLAEYLAFSGHDIILGSRNLHSISNWLPNAKIELLKWNDLAVLQKSCKSIDLVVHTAGMNAKDCAADPLSALAFNGDATSRLVEAAINAGVKRFIYLSTAHVYANPLVGDINESTPLRNPHPYATSNIAGENAVLSANQYKKDFGIVLRLSNVFGSPINKKVNCWMLLTNDLCRQAVETKKIVLSSNGLQERDFIGMSDVCSYIEGIAKSSNKSIKSNILNVGSGISLSVISMAHLIQYRCVKILGFKPDLFLKKDNCDVENLKLTYRVNELKSLGISLKKRKITYELDKLLKFCELTFG